MRDYLMVRKGKAHSWMSMGAEEKQRLMERYAGFVARLKREQRFRSGAGLDSGGTELRTERGIVLTDGPFPETKEALSGYLVFAARDEVEALGIARECPALLHGEVVEVFALSAM